MIRIGKAIINEGYVICIGTNEREELRVVSTTGAGRYCMDFSSDDVPDVSAELDRLTVLLCNEPAEAANNEDDMPYDILNPPSEIARLVSCGYRFITLDDSDCCEAWKRLPAKGHSVWRGTTLDDGLMVDLSGISLSQPMCLFDMVDACYIIPQDN